MPQTMLSTFLGAQALSQASQNSATASKMPDIGDISDDLSEASETTPTLPASEPPYLSSLTKAHKALDNITYKAIIATIPRSEIFKIGPREFIKTSYLQTTKAQNTKSKWYWYPENGLEIMQICNSTNSKFWKCARCSTYYTLNSTPTNREKHLNGQHRVYNSTSSNPQIPSCSFSEAAEAMQREETITTRLAKLLLTIPFVEKVKSTLLYWIVICHVKFSIVEDTLFMDFIRTISPGCAALLPAAGATIRSWIMEAFKTRKQDIIESITRSKSCINLSFDLWTSPNYLALLGIVAHYIDARGKNITVLLAIRQLQGPHTGENQAEIVIAVIEEFGFAHNTGYFVMDNATNNDTCVEAVLCKLTNLTEPERHARRLRCLGHVINLAVRALIYGEKFESFELEARSYKENYQMLKELLLWRDRGHARLRV